MTTETTLVFDFKTGLYYDSAVPTNCIYKLSDLKWLNSGKPGYEDADGKYYYEAIKIVAGKPQYKKIYYTVDSRGFCTLLNHDINTLICY